MGVICSKYEVADDAQARFSKAVDALTYWINYAPCPLWSPEWRKRYDELSDNLIEAFKQIDGSVAAIAKNGPDENAARPKEGL